MIAVRRTQFSQLQKVRANSEASVCQTLVHIIKGKVLPGNIMTKKLDILPHLCTMQKQSCYFK